MTLLSHHPATPYPAPAAKRGNLQGKGANHEKMFYLESGLPVEPDASGNPYPAGTLAHAVYDNPALAMVLADKPIAFHRVYLLLMRGKREGTRDALVLAKLVELANTLPVDSGGWFSLGMEDWSALTDLSYTHHLAARANLVKLGFLNEYTSGYPATKVYRVNVDVVHQAIIEMALTAGAERQAAEAAVVRH